MLDNIAYIEFTAYPFLPMTIEYLDIKLIGDTNIVAVSIGLINDANGFIRDGNNLILKQYYLTYLCRMYDHDYCLYEVSLFKDSWIQEESGERGY
jgi:hypothetical protein